MWLGLRDEDEVGSSPHTRGLHGGPGATRPGHGIIPAHAGFTSRPHAGPCQPRDHPRTRGVYPAPCSPGHVLAGIIPAHAGFTLELGEGLEAMEDHPRTRGVYIVMRDLTAQELGSSPHTRGLPPSDGLGHVIVRIIPAHAGFTARRTSSPSRPRDHPRTRGVYTWRSLESQRSWSLPPPGFLHC